MAPNAKLDGALVRALIANMGRLTWDRVGEMAMRNARANLPHVGRGKSIGALREAALGEGDSAVIVAAGPSVQRQNPARLIAESGYRGTVISTDSGIAHCLRNGVVPHLIVSLDPHPSRIVRWFGDPDLSEEAVRTDDYYRRQDLDPVFTNEMQANAEIIRLMAKHAHDMPIALATSASAAVVKRVMEARMPLYWWNPMLDDPDDPEGASRQLMEMNGLPSVNAGGNVGSAAWMIADAVLAKKHVALTGMDFAYYDGTPYSATQYYREALDLVGESNLDSLFSRIYNPHVGAWFISDPAYQWYKHCFLDMAEHADCETYNCTEGGILFGEGVHFCSLREFLSRFA